jgi:hypothetical protein
MFNITASAMGLQPAIIIFLNELVFLPLGTPPPWQSLLKQDWHGSIVFLQEMRD